eukprot:scaffold2750_cov380-Prasinococcus_capsulatus_cf.AAC.4
MSALVEVPKHKVVSAKGAWEWSVWDKIDVVNGHELTLASFISNFEAEYGLEIQMVSHGKSILFMDIFPKAKRDERLQKTIPELVTSIGKVQLAPEEMYVYLSVACVGDEDEDVDVPIVRVKLHEDLS